MDIINIITSIGTLLALGFTIYQSILAKKALIETKQSIDQEKINRQISLLPKFEYIIEVRVELESWRKDLIVLNKNLAQALNAKDFKILEEISKHRIKSPEDLNLSKYQYDNMPEWLSKIWLSGAQYYYTGLGGYVGDINKQNENLKVEITKSIIQRSKESSESISILLDYISNMVPEVILNTPASISNSRFFRK